MRGLLANALSRDGHIVVEAADGAELLQLLADTMDDGNPQSMYDLIVTDVRMPGWSGLDILVGVRHFPVPPPVIIITAFGDERIHADAHRLGAVATLDKPFDVDDLRTVVRITLQRACLSQ